MVQLTQYRLTGHLCTASSDLSADKRPKTSLDIFQDFPLENTKTGHQYTFTQVGRWGEGSMNYHTSVATKLCVLGLASSYRFLPEFGSPRRRIPIPYTCRPTKQTLLLNNSNKVWKAHKPFVFHQRNIMSQGKMVQKGCGKKFQCPS